MKILPLLVGLTIFSASATAQTITAADAQAHVGENVTVRGVIDEVHTSGKGNTFLDLGGKYPSQAFTGVIFSDYAATFPDAHALEGKTVDISGPVQMYHDKPEIILKTASQLKVE